MKRNTVDLYSKRRIFTMGRLTGLKSEFPSQCLIFSETA